MSSSITQTFEADIQKLLNILIRSVYSNRDVFLRELISNASDAIDKVRVLKVNAGEDTQHEHSIHVRLTDNVLEIFDTGIGMDKDDLQKNLSTIAHSGTSDFVQDLQDNKKDLSQFIGQFGVGFYSCFLVSEDVQVVTRKWGTEQVWKWTSDGVSTYTMEPYEGEWPGETDHGTHIRIALKDDSEEYAKESKLKTIIQQHSSFISYPIRLWTEKEREETAPVLETVEEEEEEETDEAVVVDEGVDETNTNAKEGDADKPKTIKVKYHEWEQVNGSKPLWYKEPSEIEDQEYRDMYSAIKKNASTMDEVLYWKHFKAEGKHEFQGIFFLSRNPKVDGSGLNNMPDKNIRLYVKKVMIMESCGEELIPNWMNFVTGIIDSNDLPLNVSREMLQNNSMVRNMKKYMVKQIKKMLSDFMEKDRESYEAFYENNSQFIKWGITEGEPTLNEYLLCQHSQDDNEKISMNDYIEKKLKEGQKQIFFLTGENTQEMRESFHMERFLEKDICVLYFTEPIDEFILQHMRKYKDHDMVDIGKEFETTMFDDLLKDGKLQEATPASIMPPPPPPEKPKTDEEEEKVVATPPPRKTFLEFMMDCLKEEKVDRVAESIRLDTTPACVVAKKYGWTGNMEKVMKSQPLQEKSYLMMATIPKTFEVNLQHKLIMELKSKYEEAEKEETDKQAALEADLSKRVLVLFKICTMQSGYPLKDGPTFCKDLFKMIDIVQ